MEKIEVFDYKGEVIDLMGFQPEDVDIEHIAHSLSMICRYAGSTPYFYSVAEHCVLLARGMKGSYPKAVRLMALLHDAPEAYLGDWIGPIKEVAEFKGRPFRTIEEEIFLSVCVHAGILDELHLGADLPAYRRNRAVVHRHDKDMGSYEVSCMWPNSPLGSAAERADWTIRLCGLRHWSPQQAKREFLNAFQEFS